MFSNNNDSNPEKPKKTNFDSKDIEGAKNNRKVQRTLTPNNIKKDLGNN